MTSKIFTSSRNNNIKTRGQSQSLVTVSTPTGSYTPTSPVPKVVSILGAAPQREHVLKQGWVHKKSKHIRKYHKRFMVLRGDKLECYKKSSWHNIQPTEVFDLSARRYRIDPHDTVKIKFYLVDESISGSRTFKAPSSTDRDDWVFHLRDSIITGRNLRQATVEKIGTVSPTILYIYIQKCIMDL